MRHVVGLKRLTAWGHAWDISHSDMKTLKDSILRFGGGRTVRIADAVFRQAPHRTLGLDGGRWGGLLVLAVPSISIVLPHLTALAPPCHFQNLKPHKTKFSPRVKITTRLYDVLLNACETISPSKITAMAEPQIDTPVLFTSVQVEALVVMKISKHCSASFPTTATGSLVGMDANGVLEVTNCFPFPTTEPTNVDSHQNDASAAAAMAPRQKSNMTYQNEMIRHLREVNVDANNVGWYTSAAMGNFMNLGFIENQYHYQKDNDRTVALVHDVSRSSQGTLSLRAFKLTTTFMAAYKEGKFTTEV